MKKLNSILLIDDNEHDNFYHKIIIEEAACANQVLSEQKASNALNYFLTSNETNRPCPDLVFVDINMPKMDGFEFLKKYRTLVSNPENNTVFVMLTNSVNPAHKKIADKFAEIAKFEIKPLNHEKLSAILSNYFPHHFSN